MKKFLVIPLLQQTPPMQDITEQLERLEEDGKQYAHFFAHPIYTGYYGIWIRERTPEYIRLWLPHSPLAGYTLVHSVEMPDATFCDYIAGLFPDHLNVSFLKKLYKIENLSQDKVFQLAHDFKTWKQESIRINRVKWLQQYPWLVSVSGNN